jgi:hypothetical protein
MNTWQSTLSLIIDYRWTDGRGLWILHSLLHKEGPKKNLRLSNTHCISRNVPTAVYWRFCRDRGPWIEGRMFHAYSLLQKTPTYEALPRVYQAPSPPSLAWGEICFILGSLGAASWILTVSVTEICVSLSLEKVRFYIGCSNNEKYLYRGVYWSLQVAVLLFVESYNQCPNTCSSKCVTEVIQITWNGTWLSKQQIILGSKVI